METNAWPQRICRRRREREASEWIRRCVSVTFSRSFHKKLPGWHAPLILRCAGAELKKRETIKRNRRKKRERRKGCQVARPSHTSCLRCARAKKEQKNKNTIATENNNKRRKYYCIKKNKKLAPKLQVSVMVDPLGTDLVKSGSLRANTLLNETSKTNLPQQPPSG